VVLKNALELMMGIEESKKIANPFYHNYIFSESDLNRKTIKWWENPILWILPTYVQLNDGYEFYFKHFGGRIYLMKVCPFISTHTKVCPDP